MNILNLIQNHSKNLKDDKYFHFFFFLELEILSLYLETVKGKISEFKMLQYFFIDISV